jgi:RHS repeat-associated protein
MRVASLLAAAIVCAARPAIAACSGGSCPAATLMVSNVVSPQTGGTASDVRVEARTSAGVTSVVYAGTVHFTSTDAQAVLPGDYTFTSADQGVHVFTSGVTLKSSGTQSVTATDTKTATIKGSQTGITVNPGPASTMLVSGISTPRTAGVLATVTVEVRDALGNRATGYRGTIHFTSDALAPFALPGDYTFTATDSGIHTFTNGVSLTRAGSWSVTAADTVNSSLTGSQGGIVVNPAAVSKLAVSGIPATWTMNFPSSASVEAQDQYGNRVTAYRGTVHFTSTDAQATLPANYTFTSTDAGIHAFSNGVTLKTLGTQSVTATDTISPSIAGSEQGIQVVSNAPVRFLVAGLPSSITAGTASNITVTSVDAAGNRAPAYAGRVHLTSSDWQADLPGDYTFTTGGNCTGNPCDNGLHNFSVTLKSARCPQPTSTCIRQTFQIQSVFATDTVTSSMTGGAQTFVLPASPAAILVYGFPSPVTAGDFKPLSIQAQDTFGNAAQYSGNVTVTSSDPQFRTITNVPLSVFGSGSAFSFLATAGTQSISASDGILQARPQTGIVVLPAAFWTYSMTGIPSAMTAGTSASVTVRALDVWGNLITSYSGSAQFFSNDPLATLPPITSFAGSGGIETFPNGVTLRTAGTRSVSVFDTVDGGGAIVDGISVLPASAVSFGIAISPQPPATAGVPVRVSVAALDPYGNVDTNYLGTIHFISSDPLAVLPPDFTFVPGDMGVATVSGVTFKTAGLQSLSAADTLSSSLNGTQNSISVVSAAPASLMVSGLTTPRTAGTPGSITVTALDSFGNIATGYLGTVGFTSSDPQAVLPAPTAFTAADAGTRPFVVTLKTAATQSVTATDTVNAALTGTQNGISVTPAGAASLIVSGVPSLIEGGAPASVTVDARDPYGNRATGYLGTVAFTSSDTAASLPSPYTFLAADLGLHTVAGAVRFATAGTQSITGTDTVVSTITGTQSGISVSDSLPPVWPAGSTLSGTGTSTTTAHLVWTAATDNVGVTAYRLYQNGTLVQTLGGATLATDVSGLTVGVATFFQVQAGDAAGNWTTNGPTASIATVPPDPVLVAPPIDTSVSTNTYDASSFIYSGANPIQTGVAPGTIQPTQVAVLRGTIHDRAGQPLSAVRISAVGRPEFGQTFSRADGAFDFAVNGGGLITVKYERADLLPAQRQVTPDWQDYTTLPDVVLVPQDQLVSIIDVGSTNTQVARGSVSIDDIGSRQATVIFPPGTGAMLKMPDGSTQTMGTLHVRLTELTVGPNGPSAMPGPLPPTSAYTYAAAFTADEATQAGATGVLFSQPVFGYLENFLAFPVGFAIPSGTYDAAGSRWLPESDGKVVQVLSVTNGLADLDTNGDGIADDPATLASLGVTNAELARLATLYQPGQSLWRVPLQHFSFLDWNVPLGIIDAAAAPLLKLFSGGQTMCTDTKSKCILEVQNQVLGETLPIVGTPYRLYYNSGRVPGRRANYRLDLVMPIPKMVDISRAIKLCLPNRTPECQPVTPATSMIRIDGTMTIRVAGQVFTKRTDTTAPADVVPPVWQFEWDGRDAYGRELQGEQPVSVTSCYNYPGVSYGTPEENAASFSQPSLNGAVVVYRVVSRLSAVFDVCTSAKASIGAWNVKPATIGGWTLSAQHILDVADRVLYRGDGGMQRVDDLNRYVVNFVAGTGRSSNFGGNVSTVSDGTPAASVNLAVPEGVVVGPDGSIYVSDNTRRIIARITPDGLYHIFAGVQLTTAGSDADGVLASQALIHFPAGLALGADGTLYFADADFGRIRKVTPDGRVFTVVGNGVLGRPGFSPDGTPALSAVLALDRRGQIAVGPDGTVYFAELANHRARKVGPDGILRTVAGIGSFDPQGFGGFSGDGGPARQAALSRPQGVTLGPDGALYIADSCNQRVRQVKPNGIISTVAGSGDNCRFQNLKSGGDGGPATSAGLGFPFFSLAVAPDSTLFIADFALASVRRVTPLGTIDTVAGNGFVGPGGGGTGIPGCVGDNCPGPATAVGLPESIAMGPGGDPYVGFTDNMFRIGRLRSARAKNDVMVTDIIVPSSDASEVYIFDSRGRHLRTLDAVTNAQLQLFGYDSDNRLVSITDRDGNVTTVQRDAQGNPTAIVSPYGQQTTMAVDSDGYLQAVTNPNGELVQMLYQRIMLGDPHSGGLLTRYTNARGGQSLYEYDSDGFLTKDTPPDGSFVTLDRHLSLTPNPVTYQTALGRTEAYSISPLGTGDAEMRAYHDPAGLVTTYTRSSDRSSFVTLPDGTSITSTDVPDPRFGIQAPIASTTTTRTPSGLTRTETRSRSMTLSNQNDLLSLMFLTEQVTMNGKTYQSTYDAVAKTITQRTPVGRQTVVALDSAGRVGQVQMPGVLPVNIQYDVRGRPQTVTQGTRTYSYTFDPLGRLQSTADPLHSVSLGYDGANRPTNTILPDLSSISASYDGNGNLLSVTPPGRAAHTFSYQGGDLEQDYAPPSVDANGSGHVFTGYDLDQSVTSIAPNGVGAIAPSYDTVNGRLLGRGFSAGTNSYTYVPASGRVASITAPDGNKLSYNYDGPLLLSTTFSSGPAVGTVTRTYDADFRLATEAVTGGQSITFQYDADSLLTVAGALTIMRSPSTGFVTGTTLGGVTDSRTFDSFGNQKTYSVSFGTTPLYSADYGARDALGRVVSKTETVLGEQHVYGYAYDARGRLTDVTEDGSPLSHYDYDANGNRATGPGLTASPIYDAQDRLLNYGNCAFSYKPDGSLQTKTCPDGITTYDYDSFGNLRSVVLPGGTTVSYVIDGQNRRVAKKINGALAESFLYRNQLQPLTWLDASGAVKAQFVYGAHANVPEYMIIGTNSYRFVIDQIGSVRLVVNTSTGAAAERLDYDEFGNVTMDTAPGFQPFGFAGGLRASDIGLTRFGWRDYDPVTGRWTAKDPMRFRGGMMNLYVYAGLDPINRSDPSGLLLLDRAGACAAQWYADRYVATGQWYYWLGGVFASAWTPETSDRTATVLGIALALDGLMHVAEGPQPDGPLPPGWGPDWEPRYPEGEGPGDPRWFDPNGGEWRWHEPDKWHPESHWDYNPWDNWNSPWRNVPHK